MLKIQVLGKGMIPRGYGLAPRKDFFKADLTLIHTILQCPNLKVNMLNPETNKIMPVTKTNVKTLWDKYRSDRVTPVATKLPINHGSTGATTAASATAQFNPNKTAANDFAHSPAVTLNATTTDVIKAPIVEEKPAEVSEVKNEETKADEVNEETKVEEKKPETSNTSIKPIINDNNNKNNNHNKK